MRIVFRRNKYLKPFVRQCGLELSFKIIVELQRTLIFSCLPGAFDPDHVDNLRRCQAIGLGQMAYFKVNRGISVLIVPYIYSAGSRGNAHAGVQLVMMPTAGGEGKRNCGPYDKNSGVTHFRIHDVLR